MKSCNPAYLKFFYKYNVFLLLGMIGICWVSISAEVTSMAAKTVFLVLAAGFLLYVHQLNKDKARIFSRAVCVCLGEGQNLMVEKKESFFGENVNYTVPYENISSVEHVTHDRAKMNNYYVYALHLKQPHPTLSNPIIFFETFVTKKAPTEHVDTPIAIAIQNKLKNSQLDG